MKDKPSNTSEPKSRRNRNRKRYSKPVLQTYGAIRMITEDVGSHGNMDGGTVPKTKSQL